MNTVDSTRLGRTMGGRVWILRFGQILDGGASMNRSGATRLIAACMMVIAVGSTPVSAALYTTFNFNTDQEGNIAPLSVTVLVEEIVEGDLKFTVEIVDGSITGDLRAIYFHFHEMLLSGGGLEATGTYVTDQKYGANAVIKLGGGTGVESLEKFDVGIEFGTPGMSSNDLQLVTFELSHVNDLINLNFSTFFDMSEEGIMAIRITSVGVDGGSREDSLKLVNSGEITVFPIGNGAVPEPASIIAWSVVGLGLISANYLRRRKVA